MKSDDLHCWKCGESLAEILLPFSRMAKCKSCNVDLHVCYMCKFHDTSKSNECSEPLAEKVNDKIRKNFCGYFQPDINSFKVGNSGTAAASRKELDDLFDLGIGAEDEPSKENDSFSKLNDLFGLNDDKKDS